MFCLRTVKSWNFSSLIEQVLSWVLSAFYKILSSLISRSCIQQAAFQNCILFLHFYNFFPNGIILLRNGVAEIHKQLSMNSPPAPELLLLLFGQLQSRMTEDMNHRGSSMATRCGWCRGQLHLCHVFGCHGLRVCHSSRCVWHCH